MCPCGTEPVERTIVNTTHRPTVSRSTENTVIVVPELARLGWRDRIALKVGIWVIEHTVHPGTGHAEEMLRLHAADEVASRELRSLHWLPPR